MSGTTIKSNATIKDKFLLMGHTKLTWAEMDILCMEFGMDGTIDNTDRKFFEHLQCHTNVWHVIHLGKVMSSAMYLIWQ